MKRCCYNHHGEVIPIRYPDESVPLGYFVRGHMRPEVARFILEKWYGEDELPPGMPEPFYGRWSVCQDEDGEPCQCFVEHSLPGRGRFPIMVLYRFISDKPREVE